MPGRGRPFTKGHKKVGGRVPGQPNHTTLAVKEVLEQVATKLGGIDALFKWVKKDPINERLFWSQMYMRLLPVQVEGTGRNGALVLEVRKADLNKQIEDRGLPRLMYGGEAPVIDLTPTEVPAFVTNGKGDN